MEPVPIPKIELVGFNSPDVGRVNNVPEETIGTYTETYFSVTQIAVDKAVPGGK